MEIHVSSNDRNFVYNTCQFDENKVKDVLKHFNIQYKFEEE